MYILLIILLLFILTVLFLLLKNKGQREKEKEVDKAIELKIAFNQLSRKHKLSVDEVEVFNHKLIGLDRKNSKFIWIGYIGNSLRKNCISLKDLESHRVREVTDEMDGCSREVVMEFNFSNQKPAYFVFYDRASDKISTLAFLQDKAKYWDAKIHVYLNEYYSTHELSYAL